jgi:hypothetical protein
MAGNTGNHTRTSARSHEWKKAAILVIVVGIFATHGYQNSLFVVGRLLFPLNRLYSQQSIQP